MGNNDSCFVFVRLIIAFCTISSASASKEDVASSKRIMGDFLK